MQKHSCVYILTNISRTVLYVGVTTNLIQRMDQHKRSMVPGFTYKYKLSRLIYFEAFPSFLEAVQREKQLKGWRRSKKEELIATMNPKWDEVDVSF